MAERVLVTGGTGFLGKALVRSLLDSGAEVSFSGRKFDASGELIERGARPIAADLGDFEATAGSVQGAEVVFHNGVLTAPWGSAADFHAANVLGTAAIVEGCRRAGVQRLVYVSSPNVVFDGRDAIEQREDAPFPKQYSSTYAYTKKLGEDFVRAATDLEWVIVRPKAIFGPGDGTLLPRLIAAARRGKLPVIGDGRNLVDLTYVDNAVDGILLAGRCPGAPGNTYTITNDEHIPLWDVIEAVLRALDIPWRRRKLPMTVAMLIATGMEAVAKRTGREPALTRYTVAILGRTQTYDISAAKRDLGYRSSVRVDEGIQRTLSAFAS